MPPRLLPHAALQSVSCQKLANGLTRDMPELRICVFGFGIAFARSCTERGAAGKVAQTNSVANQHGALRATDTRSKLTVVRGPWLHLAFSQLGDLSGRIL